MKNSEWRKRRNARSTVSHSNKNLLQKLRQSPILILLIVNIIVGLFTFRNYGYSWDEPLFYEYADALRYAYSPTEWFSGNFNLANAYGPSGTDHANRGPGYVIIAYPLVSTLKTFGIDNASAWHLINFLTFQLGVYLFFRFTSKWMTDSSALAATALFAYQPLLWGHSFINPKDIPFLVFFIGSMCFGFEMVDDIANNSKSKNIKLFLAALFMGIATSNRVLGPLAAVLTGFYALSKLSSIKLSRLVKYFLIYGIATLLVTLALWPYLWTNPPLKFIEVFGFMSDNPTQLTVLFRGEQYKAGELPLRYMPTFLDFSLTEPVWILFAIGLIYSFIKSDSKKRLALSLILFWFLIPVAYVLLRRPSMYDGIRHFLFILPPIFIFAGFAFEWFFQFITNNSVRMTLGFAVLACGIIPAIQLHPYEYAYFNSFTGGVNGAFRTYETEYWLTCYREAVLGMNQKASPGTQLYVRREPYIAAYYANDNISIRDFRTELSQIQSGDYVLANSRSNEDLKYLHNEPIYLSVSRMGADFCVVKQVP